MKKNTRIIIGSIGIASAVALIIQQVIFVGQEEISVLTISNAIVIAIVVAYFTFKK